MQRMIGVNIIGMKIGKKGLMMNWRIEWCLWNGKLEEKENKKTRKKIGGELDDNGIEENIEAKSDGIQEWE